MGKTKRVLHKKAMRKQGRKRRHGHRPFAKWRQQRWKRFMKEAGQIAPSGSAPKVTAARPGEEIYCPRSILMDVLWHKYSLSMFLTVLWPKGLVRSLNVRGRERTTKKGTPPPRGRKQGHLPRTEEKMPEKLPSNPDMFEALFEKWRHGVEAVSPEQEVQQWLAEKEKLGKKHYELVLNLGDDEGKKTLRELVEGERWDEALQIIHRVDHW